MKVEDMSRLVFRPTLPEDSSLEIERHDGAHLAEIFDVLDRLPAKRRVIGGYRARGRRVEVYPRKSELGETRKAGSHERATDTAASLLRNHEQLGQPWRQRRTRRHLVTKQIDRPEEHPGALR